MKPRCDRHPDREAKAYRLVDGYLIHLCRWCNAIAMKALARHPDELRWVAASTKRGVVSHAVLALQSTPPHKMTWDEKRQKWRNPRNRPAKTACGVRVRNYIAGEHHGHDFDRTSDLLKCANCLRVLANRKVRL